MDVFLQIILNALLVAAPYALVAGGLSFLYATTRIFHLAHGVVVLAGGYIFWWGFESLGWPAVLAAGLALLASAALGLAINEFVYGELRRRNAKGLGYLIATLATLLLGTSLILLLFGAAPKTFQLETASFEAGGVHVTALQLWTLAIAAALLFLFWWIVEHTRFGKAMRATADNETVARVLGIDTAWVRRYAFALASVLAAAAGILIGLEYNLDPNWGIILAIHGFTAAVIGGVGSFRGSLAGALLLGLAEQGAVWFWGSGWRNAAAFVLLFLFLLFRPEGLFGGGRKT